MSDALDLFGFGLRYITFSIGDAMLNTTKMKANESVELTIPVTNTIKCDGIVIVQV